MVWDNLVSVMEAQGLIWTGTGPADPDGRFVQDDGTSLSVGEALASIRGTVHGGVAAR